MGHRIKILILSLLTPLFGSAQLTQVQVQDTINKYIKSPIGVSALKKTFNSLNSISVDVTSSSINILTNKTMAWGSNTFTGFPFIGNTGNQTGLTGDKTTSGFWNFTSPFSTGQATFGSTGQGGKINFIEGGGGANALTIGLNNATGGIALVNSTLSGGIVFRNTAASGSISLESTGASGYVNIIAGGAQAARLFSDGNLRLGTSSINDGSKLRVDGVSFLNGAVRSTGLQTLSSASAGLKLFNTSDEVTNTEFFTVGFSSNQFNISGGQSGSGVQRTLTLQQGGATKLVLTGTSETGGVNIGYGTSGQGAIIGNNSTLSGANVNQNIFAFVPTVAQSGTASFNIIYASPFLNATGSGAKNLIDVGTNSAANNGGTHTSRFSVTNTGKTTQSGDLELTANSGGIFTKSPNGTRYKITVSDAGVLVVTAAP